MSKKKKTNNKKRKKQRFLAWVAIIITAINFLLIIAFVVYLYFWVKAR
jgi:large-conductance mechanosensitive channel|tara:strand:+ start:462 stop:605 length:144 start_codon:yes stop_codon:yes gene_type:complete